LQYGTFPEGLSTVLDRYYEWLHQSLLQAGTVPEASWREHAGHRFYYVKSPLPAHQVAKLLLEAGESIAAGTKLQVESIYVRSHGELHVFRFRFLVPAEKQFCCGNLCKDCFLLRQETDSR
jgi:hypothetical protein